jgi:hypothetical protein
MSDMRWGAIYSSARFRARINRPDRAWAAMISDFRVAAPDLMGIINAVTMVVGLPP